MLKITKNLKRIILTMAIFDLLINTFKKTRIQYCITIKDEKFYKSIEKSLKDIKNKISKHITKREEI